MEAAKEDTLNASRKIDDDKVFQRTGVPEKKKSRHNEQAKS